GMFTTSLHMATSSSSRTCERIALPSSSFIASVFPRVEDVAIALTNENRQDRSIAFRSRSRSQENCLPSASRRRLPNKRQARWPAPCRNAWSPARLDANTEAHVRERLHRERQDATADPHNPRRQSLDAGCGRFPPKERHRERTQCHPRKPSAVDRATCCTPA